MPLAALVPVAPVRARLLVQACGAGAGTGAGGAAGSGAGAGGAGAGDKAGAGGAGAGAAVTPLKAVHGYGDQLKGEGKQYSNMPDLIAAVRGKAAAAGNALAALRAFLETCPIVTPPVKHTDDDLRALLGTNNGRPLSDLTDLLSEMRGRVCSTRRQRRCWLPCRHVAPLSSVSCASTCRRRQVTSTGPMTSVRLSLRA